MLTLTLLLAVDTYSKHSVHMNCSPADLSPFKDTKLNYCKMVCLLKSYQLLHNCTKNHILWKMPAISAWPLKLLPISGLY